MALQASPFPNGCAAGAHAVGWALVLPCFWFLDRLIAICMSTTLERRQRLEQECYLHPLKVFFGSVIFFILFLVTTPLALLGFLLWAPLQACRRPFYYHYVTPSPPTEKDQGFEPTGKMSFGFATSNLCLLPDSLARFNNLGDTQRRATAIGQRIVQGLSQSHSHIFVESPNKSILAVGKLPAYGTTDSQIHPQVIHQSDRASPEGHTPISMSSSLTISIPCDDTVELSAGSPTLLTNSNQNSNQQDQRDVQSAPQALLSHGVHQKDGVPWEVSPLFPANVDILCLEEVFDKRAAQRLTQALSPAFGHILYDIGVYAFQPPCSCSHFKFFNSGMFVASRFPVLEAQFHWFPNSRGEDALAAKGLLSAKVLVAQNENQKRLIGYFNCTHLHAPEGEGEVRCEQLNLVTKWIGEFQAENQQPDENVVFDVLCGDFNFDNCSPDDALEQNHCLFEEYRDPCRAEPGKDKPWVTGTLLEQPTLYDEDVNTPECLQRTLETEELRKQYISPPVPAEGRPLIYPESGNPWIGRRIDYILYRESSTAKRYRTEIEKVTFITQLAGLTDHIPVGLRLRVISD
ncbi:sphingomyelin phosphodiesterase 5 [Thalassophryne amazonica]|uniref:sphingomyelin phosphodiesterase 5 n=1 Tax=Thalassophryne amazonica TaxID=390379 RepID=UPI00147163B4|nr:sphingomyelin phosphodiesterase 5 [Thalassophryne amazonica]